MCVTLPCKMTTTMRLFSTKMNSRTFYEILQIPPNSSSKEIKSQYFKMCKLFHPDIKKKPEGSNEFQEITTAYETLKDSKKRREYDRTLALTKYEKPSHKNSLKDFNFEFKIKKNEISVDETQKFWSKRDHEMRKRSEEEQFVALNERLEEMKVFRNRILVFGAILFGYWLSNFNG